MLSTIFLLQLFQRSYADVFVYPTILQERTTTKNLVLRLNTNLTLNLERSSVLADELVVVTSSHGGDQLEKVDTSAIQEVLYQDTHHQSSLMVRHREGSVHVEGIINHELRIKPLPEDERSLQGRILHKIYKVQEIKGTYANIEPALTNVFQRSNVGHQGKAKGQNNRKPPQSTSHGEPQPRPNVEKFTVELHVISDSVHQKSFKKNEELIAYLAIMTNGVNLRYLDMRNPRISFILVGLTRSTNDPFANHMKGFLYGPKTLDGLTAYKKQGKIPGNPDVVHLLTGQDLVTLKDGNMDQSLRGLAFIGAVCSSYDVGESEDTAMSYDGTMVMAHELGHVLGSPHDDGWSKDPECAWGHGYLMSYVDGGVKKYRLSKCSEDKIRTAFK
ncbi:venom metalloproteinase antarease-like TtrivMP_A [Dermacentor silvarum]|uniref:venom metalloproteinase antarease-like TtrivMP_A n=1 Tax=Dermacentor silvarum TaxID=543639 RepID=UPI002100BCDA|nr:venom metalloproteinase antarease-like TtrivMP_A [Dermacentor silvarum]